MRVDSRTRRGAASSTSSTTTVTATATVTASSAASASTSAAASAAASTGGRRIGGGVGRKHRGGRCAAKERSGVRFVSPRGQREQAPSKNADGGEATGGRADREGARAGEGGGEANCLGPDACPASPSVRSAATAAAPAGPRTLDNTKGHRGGDDSFWLEPENGQLELDGI